jgi:hypothetical protein
MTSDWPRVAVASVGLAVMGCSAAWLPDWLRDPVGPWPTPTCLDSEDLRGGACEPRGFGARVMDGGGD